MPTLPIALHLQRGITLIEMLIVIVLAAILAAFAVPNMSEFIKNNARSTRMNSLVTAFNVARNDAISQRRQTTVCASTDFATCAGNNVFETGFIVISGATLVRAFQPDGAGYTLRGISAGPPVAGVNQVTYDTSGRSLNLPVSVSFRYCDDRGPPQARLITLSALGQPRASAQAVVGCP
jgi:type IV fimbrial biogenesis protein FimT